MILDPDACMYDACMKDAYIHDPWPWCMYVWCIYLWSLILMHVCMMQVWMMHVSMIFDPDTCICDAGFFRVGRTDGRTDEQADSRSWIHFLLLNWLDVTRSVQPNNTRWNCPGLFDTNWHCESNGEAISYKREKENVRRGQINALLMRNTAHQPTKWWQLEN